MADMEFRRLTLSDIPRLQPFLASHPFQSCDFTVGGIFLWADKFDYRACIAGDTLYISGHPVNNPDLLAFSLPLGPKPIDESLLPLREYCHNAGVRPVLSSVPEEALSLLIDMGARHVEQLYDWSDYIYSAETLATLSGKKLAKKRNHVNRFETVHPDAVFRPVTPADTEALVSVYNRIAPPGQIDSEMAAYDRTMTLHTLGHLGEFPFTGAVLEVPGAGPVAFTFGETVGNTLHVHIEKMDHEVAGAGETICHRFVRMMRESNPEITWVNRQDDSGDQGLRRAKLSLHPAFLLHKYNVEF